MAEDIVTLVNETGEREEMPDRIQFLNIHHELTLSDLYADEVGHNDNDIYATYKNWEDKTKPYQNINLVTDIDINDDELEDIAVGPTGPSKARKSINDLLNSRVNLS